MSFIGGEFRPDANHDRLVRFVSPDVAMQLQHMAHGRGIAIDMEFIRLAQTLSLQTDITIEEAMRSLLSVGIVAKTREVPLGRTGWPAVVIALLVAAVVTYLITRLT